MNTKEIKRENFINLYDENGKKHGLWEYYHDNGQLSSKVNYENGKQHGLWEYYFDNGQLRYKANYLNGKPHGLWEDYWRNGQLHYRKEYDNGVEVQPVKELTMDEIAEKFGISVSELRIIKE